MRTLISWLTMRRGREMFTDVVNGKPVYEYFDRYGKKWMAQRSDWFFRVEIDHV